MVFKEFSYAGKRIIIEPPEIYVDNESRKRSGHMSHAMAEFAPGCFIDFNSNCSAVRLYGHMPYGWVEYRISKDAGKTYSDVKAFDYSLQSFYDGIHSISVEKAVATDKGEILAFCLRNDAESRGFCEPWSSPTLVKSSDGGETWGEPVEFIPDAGRIYAALYHEGVAYVMLSCNPRFIATSPDIKYKVYKSYDNGDNWELASEVPIDPRGRAYCAMVFDKENALHAYIYNSMKEDRMDHAISRDFGKTWEILEPCFVDKAIRNPQIGYLDGLYILHGRAGQYGGFVMYASTDATNWSEGVMISEPENGCGSFYSNNLPLRDENGNFLLVQYSEVYDGWGKVNVMHLKVRVEDIK